MEPEEIKPEELPVTEETHEETPAVEETTEEAAPQEGETGSNLGGEVPIQ